jgi:hypothetical protein
MSSSSENIFGVGECSVVIFKTKPIKPFYAKVDKNENYPMFYIQICPISYCNLVQKTNKWGGEDICQKLRENHPELKNSDYLFGKYIGENKNYFAYLDGWSSSGDFSEALGWETSPVKEVKNQMLSSFKFIESAATSVSSESIYELKINANTLKVYRRSFGELIYTKKFDWEIKSVDLREIDNGFAFLIAIKDPKQVDYSDPYSAIFNQQIIEYDINSGKENIIYSQQYTFFPPLEIITINEQYYFLLERSFEGMNSLLRLDKNAKTVENLSTLFDFWFLKIKVSPDGRYLAADRLLEKDGGYIGVISFYDVKNKKIINSQLKVDVSGQFPGGLTGFGLREWANDSSAIEVVTTDNKHYLVSVDGTFKEQ